MAWWEDKPKPSRAYAFRRRVDRQRIAHRLAHGQDVTTVARVERCAPEDIDRLLRDPGFHALVRHWEEIAALDPEARLERLTAMALELIELAVAAGDLRVAMFVAHERSRGRHPGRTVAERVVATLVGRAEASPRPVPPPAAPPPTTATPARAIRDPFAFCAGTIPSAAGAARLAEVEAGRVGRRLGAIRVRLAQRLTQESERTGTTVPRDARARARTLGRSLHRPGGYALEAAVALDAHRRAYLEGAPPPLLPDTG